MPVAGKLEVIIKISEFPEDVKTVTNNWKEFVVEADGKEVTITTRPKMFNKIEQAKQQFPQWVAAINGKIGDMNEKGFNLTDASIQVFERKPKPETPTQSGSSQLIPTTKNTKNNFINLCFLVNMQFCRVLQKPLILIYLF